MEFFDRFQKIYLWLDADEVGKRSAEKFAEVLGSNRTIIIDPTFNQVEGAKIPKDANDALRMGQCFRQIMTENARWLDQSKVLNISSLQDKI